MRLFLLLSTVFGIAAATSGAQQGFDDSREALDRAQRLETEGKLEEALEIYGSLSEQPQPRTSVWVLKGTVLLRLGRIADSLGAFESAIDADPGALPYLWQRGIAQFYDGQFEECAQQFVSHQTVNPNDVENAAWHFLCVAADDGVDRARESLLPVGRDPRIPMDEIYELFAGRGSVEQVLDSASRGPEDIQADHLFYAHLYLGLLAQASGDEQRALGHYREANSKKFPYVMGDVARVALSRLEGKQQ